MEIIKKHFSHEHVLSLSEKKREDPFLCKGCNEDAGEGVMIYSCRESDCRFDLHESCANLPQELDNPDLHPHPLSLVYPKPGMFRCEACRNSCSGFTFCCEECVVNFDVECAFIRPAIEEVVGTHHFSHHEHPLLPLEKIPARRINCSVCGKYCSDRMSYGCLRCRFYMHPSCFKLPEKILHPFHPYHGHRLTLKPIKDKDVNLKCKACRKDIDRDNFAYFCEDCNNTTSFCLDLECASVIMPAISYEGHDHLLHFNDNIGKQCYEVIYCSACEHTIRESYAFRCLYCNVNLHLKCGPLPYTIQHQLHIHPLILTICPMEDEKDCEPDEFYCYSCEKERDKLLPIYYCKECPFVAEFPCVISEVSSVLKGEHEDVELRNPLGQFGKLIRNQEQLVINPALTMSDILKFHETDGKQLNFALREATHLLRARKGKTNPSKDWDCREIIFNGDEVYTRFMKFVDIGIEIPTEFRETEDVQISDFKFCHRLLLEEEVVNIEAYKITRKLAFILKGLLSKYGDVSAQSNLSLRAKLYFFHMLCECLYSMKIKNVVDITTNDLLNWWTSLEISKCVGFEIPFAFDHLKRIALAHFGLYIEEQGSEALDKLDREIEALKEKRERLPSVKSRLIEKCETETSMLKGWKAGVGILKAGVGLL